MNPDTIRERLSLLREMDFAGAEKLAEEITKDVREPLGDFARVIQASIHQDRSKVVSILKLLDELSILPWLSASRELEGSLRIESLSEAYRAYDQLQLQVIEKLRGMLAGQTPVPPPVAPGAIEVKVPVTRECDEAYLLLRRLHAPDEFEADYRRRCLSFARMTEEERTRIIHHYVETEEFQ
jgi:hypothetical protein